MNTLRHERSLARAFAKLPWLLLLAPWSCSSVPPSAESVGVDESRDEIAPFDDPGGLLGRVSRRLVDNIGAADVGRTFGVPDERVPYPDSYWPMVRNGIDVVWNGDAPSPLEKYMHLADPSHLEEARRWNRTHQGEDYPGVQGWYGICHGWSAAAVAERPVVRPVIARVRDGRAVPCASEAEDPSCVRFELGDVNALLAQIYVDARSRFIGARCDTASSRIVRDEHGRIDREANGRGCKGLNPGSLVIVLGHRLKRDRAPLVIDAQTDYHTDQIWNQPAYRYTVHRLETLTEAEATNLVAGGTREGPLSRYLWNDRARGFVLVDLTLYWVTENGPNTEYVSGLASTRTTRMVAVVELDRSATDASALIIGGEYLHDDDVGATRLEVPPFVWVSLAPGPERPSSFQGHNPYVRTSLVKQLAALGQ